MSICPQCTRTLHDEESILRHYFCTTRTSQERRLDRLAIESLGVLPTHYCPDSTQFCEYVEELKVHLYTKVFSPVPHLYLLMTELLAKPITPTYRFNECLFILPSLKNFPTLAVAVTMRILDTFKASEIRHIQWNFLAHAVITLNIPSMHPLEERLAENLLQTQHRHLPPRISNSPLCITIPEEEEAPIAQPKHCNIV